jgi:hAT family C-terminal dimerisation region
MDDYPHVAIATRILLSIPATSLFSEITFSHAGLILCGNRSHLKPATAEMHAFLGINTILLQKNNNK